MNAEEREQIARAKAGSSRDFEALVKASSPELRRALRRLIGQKEDVEDVAQDALIEAWGALRDLGDDLPFSRWLSGLGAKLSVSHLRSKKRWRENAQLIFAQRALKEAAVGDRLSAALQSTEFAYDVREHIAYCFVCVGRSMDPEKFAALVMCDVEGWAEEDAAASLGIGGDALAHHLGTAREELRTTYDRLCALSSENGICNQCQGLRDLCQGGRQGPEVPAQLPWEERIIAAREADLDGLSRPLHDVLFRQIDLQEENRLGNEDTEQPEDADT